MHKLITALFPSFIVPHSSWLWSHFMGYNFKEGKGQGVRGGGAVFLTGAHLAFNACRWLPVARWPLPGPGPAPRRRHRLRHRRARSCPRPPPAVPPPSPGLGEQLHGSSQVAGIFNCEANESTIVQVCTYPASPRRDRKANPPFSFKTRIWRFALSSEGGEGGWGELKQYFSCKIKCKIRCFNINNAPF